jgi:ProP effector
MIELLAERLPQAFAVYERRRRPLKVGIHLDILVALDGAVTEAELRHALRVYCTNIGYFDRCRIGAVRIDLAGNECGVVTAEQAGHAAEAYGRILAKRARRKATARKQSQKAVQPVQRKRDGFAALREAARRRKAGAA